jgi:hypothetical protein
MIDLSTKPQNNYEIMYDLYVTKRMSIREIGSLLHISTKLVNIKIEEFDLKR